MYHPLKTNCIYLTDGNNCNHVLAPKKLFSKTKCVFHKQELDKRLGYRNITCIVQINNFDPEQDYINIKPPPKKP